MIFEINKVAMALAGGALGVALGSQYLLGANPCDLCILQRYPYVAVLIFTLIAMVWRKKQIIKVQSAFAVLIMLAFVSTATIAAYHVGVEQGWVNTPESCASKPLAGASLEELKAAILGAPKVSCKDVGAAFAGVSMAAWNMIYGLFSAFIIGYLWNPPPLKT